MSGSKTGGLPPAAPWALRRAIWSVRSGIVALTRRCRSAVRVGVGPVGDDPPDPHPPPVHVDAADVAQQREQWWVVACLTWGEDHRQRQPGGIDGQVELGRQSAAGASEALPTDGEVLDPLRAASFFRAPAVCRCARTLVEPTPTTNTTSSSSVPGESSLTITCSRIRSHVPSPVHFRSRSCAVLHGPYRCGRSRYGAPVRSLHRIASITCRWLRHRPPGCPLCAGGNGAITAHALSVSSPRPTTHHHLHTIMRKIRRARLIATTAPHRPHRAADQTSPPRPPRPPCLPRLPCLRACLT